MGLVVADIRGRCKKNVILLCSSSFMVIFCILSTPNVGFFSISINMENNKKTAKKTAQTLWVRKE